MEIKFMNLLKLLKFQIETFLKLKEKYQNNENILVGKTIIIIFQRFNGKFVDILLLVKNKKENE